MQFDPTLYVITDSTYHTTETLLRAVDEACRGGATLIQLREKDTGGRSYLELAQQVKSVTDRYSVPLIIDDRVDVPCLRCSRRTCRRETCRWRFAGRCSARIRSSARLPRRSKQLLPRTMTARITSAPAPFTRRYPRYHQGYAGLRSERCVPRGPDSGGCHRRPERRINMDVLADSPIKASPWSLPS